MKTRFKHVGLLVKRSDMTFEHFMEHWTNVHSEIAQKTPGLLAYTINPIDRREYPDSPIDGFSELWFDSIEDAKKAFDGKAGEEAFADVPNFCEKVAATYIQEVPVVE